MDGYLRWGRRQDTYHTSFSEIAGLNSAIVRKAICKYDVYKFNILRHYFPNLKSTDDFISNAAYLGEIKIDLVSKYEKPSLTLLLRACINVLGKIADYITGIEEAYIGNGVSRILKEVLIYEVNRIHIKRGFFQKDR